MSSRVAVLETPVAPLVAPPFGGPLVAVKNQPFTEIDGGITAPIGFKAAGIYAGIRKVKKDLALIVSDVPATVAAVFTQNKTIAAPLIVDKAILAKSKKCKAILVNSGNANACTGERGMIDAWRMVQKTAEVLGIESHEVLISSTGVIGQFLPMDRIEEGIALVAKGLTPLGNLDAAEAIMTTDTFSKQIAVEFEIGGKTVTIGAMAKGSGMIAPNMATMLAYITTDASIEQPVLQKYFSQSIDRSFNRVSVDGDMSTNDMAVMLANGFAGNEPLTARSPELPLFVDAMEHVVVELAKMIAKDGEGATKLVEVNVTGAKTEAEAVAAGRAVANSNLVKTAIHGEDANWGRILAAVGYSGIDFNPESVSIAFGEVPVLEKNYNIVLDEALAKAELSKDTIAINIDLDQGTESATFWTCDLTKNYVHINASYRS